MLAACLLLVLVLSSSAGTFPWMVASVCLPMALVAGIPARLLLMRLLHPLLVCGMVLAFKLFLGSGPTVTLFHLAGHTIAASISGLRDGLVTAARIMGAVSVLILSSRVLTFTEAMTALAWLHLPRGLVEVTMFAWRYLFLLYDDAATLYAAQKNRLGYSGIRRGLKSFGAMAGLLVIRAFESSEAMTRAMTQRGYDGTLPLRVPSRPCLMQVAWLLLFAAATTTVWTLQN
jgi:cobalt/nickel transport system permease protein